MGIVDFFLGFLRRPANPPQGATVGPLPVIEPKPQPSVPVEPVRRYGFSEVSELPQLSSKEFFDIVRPMAKEIEARTGIIYLVPMAQAAHESRYGNSKLARQGCNLFGITATKSWNANSMPTINFPTTEFIEGKAKTLNREFRAYPSWLASFEDWASIITGLKAYSKAWNLMKDEQTLFAGVRSMGAVYATDPAYAKKLISLIEAVKEA